MNLRSRHFLVLLLLFWALALGGQSRVNPTVKVLPRPAAPLPAECDESLAPQTEPRIQTAEVQPVERDRGVDLLPPPSRDLRAQLTDAQDAIERNDRESFRTALAAIKGTLASYPPGGERNAANDVAAVYNDIDRLWDYQYSSPTGAFFDETVQGGALLAAVRRYNGYDDYIQRQLVTDASGIRLYPTRESREFLTRIANDRLGRVGVSVPRTRTATATPAPVDRKPPPVVSTPRSGGQPRVTTTTPRRETPRASTQPSTSTPRRSTTKVARITPAPSRKPVSEGTPTETPATNVRPTPAPASPTTRTVTSGAPPTPAATTTTTTRTATSAAPPVAAPAGGVAGAPPSTDTRETAVDPNVAIDTAAAPDTTGTSAETIFSPAPTDTGAPTVATRTTSKTRSVILPLILILIGVGVLIVLFRASS
jgi:hypothetical protein